MTYSEGQGRRCATLILLTPDFEEKPSLREFLIGSLAPTPGPWSPDRSPGIFPFQFARASVDDTCQRALPYVQSE